MRLATRQTLSLTVRALLALWRQPWFVAITLVQPMIWLLLFGALFKKVVEIPGFHGGSYLHFLTPGVVVMLVLPVLLGGAVAALSNAMALVTRQEESLIGAVQFVVLPASFLSSGMMASNLLPGWIHDVARFNPVNWTVTAVRSSDWSLIGEHAGLLLALMLVCAWVATRAFRVYQRAV